MFVLIETEKFANSYSYREEYEKLEDAKARMMDMYHNIVIEGNVDAIEKAVFHERSAIVVLNDGNEIEWDITEE